MKLDCRGITIDLATPVVMGILNVTPDSFSDGGKFASVDVAVARAREMIAEGAAIIDVGGESTRPGAAPVDGATEIDRIVPVISTLAREIHAPISVDTRKPEVMRAAIEAGAHLINDVNALRAPGAMDTVRTLDVPVCLMHMRGEPGTMQAEPTYREVVTEVLDFLRERVDACVAAGIARERMVIDPGFGFGKTVKHNLALLRDLQRFGELGLPLLVGLSRKSSIGKLLDGAPVDERLHGSIALTALAIERGASIIRTHDVRATLDAVKVVTAALDTN